MKKNIIIVFLLIIIVLMGGSFYYLYTNKDKVFVKCPETSKESKEDNNESDNKKIPLGKYVGKISNSNEKGGHDINIEVAILSDSEITVTSDDTLSEIETTKGIYKINGNIITYERTKQINHDSNEWVDCEPNNQISERINCAGIGDNISKKENFIIDIKNKKMYSTNYIGSSLYGYGPVVLNYTEQ